MINNVELNAILYYADFLSLQCSSIPVTDNCKYYFIHNVPMNSCFIIDLEPIYDDENKYFQQAQKEYLLLRDKFGEEGVLSFIDKLANLSSCGVVGAEQMLKSIHQYSTKYERRQAFKTYNNWKNNKKYTHITINEDGREVERECSMYTYHAERMREKSGMAQGIHPHSSRYENKTLESLV